MELISLYRCDKTALQSTLHKAAQDLSLHRYQCLHLLNIGEYQLLSIDPLNVPPEELKKAVRWRLKDMLDYHVDDATIDVLAIPLDKSGPLHNNALFAVVVRNKLIEQRQQLFEGANIALRVIDIPEMAQRNIAALIEPEGHAVALLSFNTEGGLVTITFGGELYLSRRMDTTITHLQRADKSQLELIHERITLDLQRSLDHFERQYHSLSLSKLVLSPMGAEGAALENYLSTNLYIPVEILNLDTILDFSKVPTLNDTENQQRYFITLGAALRIDEKKL
ncbi:agglutinin biogenesis protein MshI [Glaciimonas immobilis]|uniref:MSHA biogenesis protein MshI n=1 Tax=Glaciimonas immobilis TaxID=728004 RepID=A0A840RP37_9BURK|nr:agglutinin biogenesis protein MshI [Glaciimonas immobilis]MBB5198410.1 MSHA biogenesis protein MshI [Glaciimonas immobilis]